MRAPGKQLRKRIFASAALVAIVAGMLAAIFAPMFTKEASAISGTNVTLPIYGTYAPFSTVKVATCEAYFTSELKSGALMNRYFRANTASLIGRNIVGEQVDTLIGRKTANDSNNQAASTPNRYLGYDHIQHVLAGGLDNSYTPVIRFRAGTAAPINGGIVPNTENICESLALINISNDEWRGVEIMDYSTGSDTGNERGARYMRFVMKDNNPNDGQTTGDFYFYDMNDPNVARNGGAIASRSPRVHGGFVIDGAPTVGGGGPGNINVESGRWHGVSKIELTGGEGGIFTKSSWDERGGKSIYFLTDAGATPNPDRAALINAPRCQNPLPIGTTCPEAGGQSNCVPFIAVEGTINFSRVNGTGDFQTRLDALGRAQMKYYGYEKTATGCRSLNPTGTNITSKVGFMNYASYWFYYSKVNNRFATMFKTGDGNEAIYIGEYAESGAITYNGGQGGCAGVISLLPGTDKSSELFTVDWQLGKPDLACNAPNRFYGTVRVGVIGGAPGEEGFGEIIDGTNPNTELPTEDLKICNYGDENGLSWFICPIILGGTKMVGLFDSLINKLLDVETNRIFDQSTATGRAYYKAWSVFRTFAIALIVIAALVMVLAQAAGIDVLDAYTIKKILPRLLMASIGIALSWDLLELAVSISNDLGKGIRSIIYAPFSSLQEIRQLNQGTSFVLLLLGTGAILVYGIFALLSLIVTAILASLVAVGLLAFREIAIVFAIIISPLAIACAIMPNTQKAWKFWSNSFMGLLMVFLLISAFIALGRAFSATAATDDAVGGIIAVIAWFAPYFLIPFAFRMAGGVIATVGGIVNDRTRGAFDRLKNYRSNAAKTRGKKMKEGTLYEGSRFIPGSRTAAKAFNRVSMGVAGGANAHFGLPTARGRAYVGQQRFGAADQLVKSEQFHRIKENDDALRAATYRSSSEAMEALQAQWGDRARARQAVAAVQASGIGFGAVQQVAAAKAMIDTGTAYADMEDWSRTAARVANGNKGTLADVVGYGNAVAKKNRMDLTPGFGDLYSVSERVMEGGAVTQGTWDGLTLQALRNSGAPSTIAAQAKKSVYDNLVRVAQRSEAARRSPADAAEYGLSPDGLDSMRSEVVDMAVELTRANYAAGSAQASAQAFGALESLARRGVTSEADAAARIARGSSRAFGGPPPGAGI